MKNIDIYISKDLRRRLYLKAAQETAKAGKRVSANAVVRDILRRYLDGENPNREELPEFQELFEDLYDIYAKKQKPDTSIDTDT